MSDKEECSLEWMEKSELIETIENMVESYEELKFKYDKLLKDRETDQKEKEKEAERV